LAGALDRDPKPFLFHCARIHQPCPALLDPCLGKLLLVELSVAHVHAMFTAIARHNEALGKPMSPATLNRIRATLRTALNAAIRQGLLTDNPATRVELPGRTVRGRWCGRRLVSSTGRRPVSDRR